MPVFDIVDRLISYFKLGTFEAGIPFLNTLQDLVLDLSSSETNDIPFFLEWWFNEGYLKSVASPEQDDSIQLMTIHKSKGLQFKVVIVPFLSWNLGHGKNPVVWVYSESEPFNKLGAVPVRYKKEIAETHFKKYYDKEKLNVAIDKLNLLYVALTRSEECLYGFIPVSNRRDTSIGTMIGDAIFDGEEEYSFGSIPSTKAIDSDAAATDSVIIPYNVTISEERLRLRMNAGAYMLRGEDGNARVSYGLLMHDILSRVENSSNIETALMYSFNRGEISAEQKIELETRLKKRFENPVVKEWFSEKYESWIEQDIILPGGEIRRPDRVVFFDDYALVIDFKFGIESRSHFNQVQEYMGVVQVMTAKRVEGAIWYLDNDKIVKVTGENKQ
jgi:ATP-dependent helicase/nuclease subunit A